MNRRRFCLGLAFTLSLLLAFAIGQMKSSTAGPATSENAAFTGEAVAVIVEEYYTIPLEHPHVRKVGDELFLVGKWNNAGAQPSWPNGQTTWVPMRRITELVEFKNVEELKNAQEKLHKQDVLGPPIPTQAGGRLSPIPREHR